MKYAGKTIGNKGDLVEVFECELCGWRTLEKDSHRCEEDPDLWIKRQKEDEH